MNPVADYDYELPPDRIASTPLANRDDSRLMVVDRRSSQVAHRTVRDLPGYIQPGDCLVLNDTRVLPARLFGTRVATGGKWEGLFVSRDENHWRLLCQTRGKLQPGEVIAVRPAHATTARRELLLMLLACDDEGVWTARPQPSDPSDRSADDFELLLAYGTMPLPPYIGRTLADAADFARYQTVYSSEPGAIAAPTAGLHFTDELLGRCESAGATVERVTLHVGIGTFRPVQADDLEEHRMHSEWCRIAPDVAERLRTARAAGGRTFAVGTTTVRTLESAARDGGLQGFSGETNLFIRPPYKFRAVDCLLTNFHLPRSTLLVLVSAMLGRKRTLAAYAEAIAERYRFYSYGDAMLIV